MSNISAAPVSLVLTETNPVSLSSVLIKLLEFLLRFLENIPPMALMKMFQERLAHEAVIKIQARSALISRTDQSLQPHISECVVGRELWLDLHDHSYRTQYFYDIHREIVHSPEHQAHLSRCPKAYLVKRHVRGIQRCRSGSRRLGRAV